MQTPSLTATTSVTVNAVTAQGAPAAPSLSGPTEVQVNSGPYTAAVALEIGVNAQWSITGGTLVTASNRPAVRFQAGSAPYVTLSCTVTNGAGSVTTNRRMAALPFTPRNYFADVKAQLSTYSSAIGNEVVSGDSRTYYYTSYYLHGMAAAADASGDTAIMDQLIGYINQMIAQAKPLVRNGITYQEFGPWGPDGNPWLLYTFQVTSALARTAAIIRTNPAFSNLYATQANTIIAFVNQSIYQYWFDKNVGIYADPSSSWLGGDIPWVTYDQGRHGSGYTVWNDKCSHFGAMSAWMYQATGNPLYMEYATRIATSFKTHVTVQSNGSWIWDQGIIDATVDDGNYADNLNGSPDTSHANREPMMAVAMYEAGIVFTLADLQAMALTLTGTIWNQSTSNPMFANYINGGNQGFSGHTGAGENGYVYLGWNMLGKYSAQAQYVLAIFWNAVLTQSRQNASEVGNGTSYALVEMPGTLARNLAP